MNTLQSSKRTSEEVAEQLEIAEQTEAKIDAAREVLCYNIQYGIHTVFIYWFNPSHSRATGRVQSERLSSSL